MSNQVKSNSDSITKQIAEAISKFYLIASEADDAAELLSEKDEIIRIYNVMNKIETKIRADIYAFDRIAGEPSNYKENYQIRFSKILADITNRLEKYSEYVEKLKCMLK